MPNSNDMQHDSHSTLYWIVDSGATDHISHLTPTHNNIKASHDFIGLPNGGHAAIESIGSIKLSKYLSLDGVLYVPKFLMNLISMSKLTRALKCIVIFYLDFYVVQDVVTKRTIGQGKYFNGLDYLTPTQNPHLANHITHTLDLWHQGLGHPSSAPVQFLSQVIP